jgi:hypothetical protein
VLLLLVAIPISPVAGIICLGANCRLCAVSIRLRFLGACSASPIRFVGSEVLFVLGICYLGGFLRLCQSNLRARVPTNSMALFIPVVVCSASFVELAKLFVCPFGIEPLAWLSGRVLISCCTSAVGLWVCRIRLVSWI